NNAIFCQSDVTPYVVVKNTGDSTINNVYFTYQLNQEGEHYDTLNRVLQAGDTAHVILPTITALSTGNYELIIRADMDSSITELDIINNQRAFRFDIRETTSTLPFYEGFESTQLDSSSWLILNPDAKITWDTIATQGLPNSLFSAYINLYNYSPRKGQKDAIVTPKIKLPLRDSIYIKFDVAYQMIHNVV